MAQSAKRFPVKSQIVRCNTKIGKFWQILGFFYQKQEVDLFAVLEAWEALPEMDLTKKPKIHLFTTNLLQFVTNPQLGTLQFLTILRSDGSSLQIPSSSPSLRPEAWPTL